MQDNMLAKFNLVFMIIRSNNKDNLRCVEGRSMFHEEVLGSKQSRDLRKFNYTTVACPTFRMHVKYHKGDACEFAHGVFEYWLHPAR
jgi:hypothetical protein